MYDLVIKNAQIADGIGGPLRNSDVAVKEGRIAEIGRITAQAKQAVNADGLTLAPGIVDVHTHYDAQLTWDRTASPSPALGVTTVVIGNCGFGIAPAPANRRETIAKNLSEVEGMSLTALENGIDWDFESFADYLALLRAKGSFPNVAAFVGHSTVRSVVMGDEASQRAATEQEITQMQQLVRESIDAGAIGFASSQSLAHNGYGGVPMPSRLAEEAEFHALLGVLKESGKGVFQMTLGPVDKIDFLERLAETSQRPIIFSALFYNDAFPQRAPSMLQQCREAQARGHKIYAQVACQPLSMEFSLANAYPMQSLEVWEKLLSNDKNTLIDAFSDEGFRDAFRDQLSKPALGKLFYGNWQLMEVAQVSKQSNRELEGKTLADIAAQRNVDPVDLFFDLALEEDLNIFFSAKLLNADDDKVEPLLKHEASVVSLSDAGAHLAYLCDAGYGLTLLQRWVKEREVFTLEEAVRQLTSVPADLYGIRNRGRIVAGAQADLMLFDHTAVSVSNLKRAFDLPAGESRLIRESSGMDGVWVNGVRVWQENDYCDPESAPGEILDRFAV